jgi:Lysylphosphatidylglycerol synthase TM region
VMGWALDRALRLAKRPPLERRISGAGVLRAAAWSLAGWAFFSVHSWLLVAGVTGKGLSVLPIAAGAYALAWSVGFVLIPFPGGVGPRELALIAALAPVMPRGSAIVVAVVSRLVLTIGDLVWAAVAFGLGRGGQRGAQGVARDGATATRHHRRGRGTAPAANGRWADGKAAGLRRPGRPSPARDCPAEIALPMAAR